MRLQIDQKQKEVKAHGTYEFTIKDVITDKTYTKIVEVTNIDTII